MPRQHTRPQGLVGHILILLGLQDFSCVACTKKFVQFTHEKSFFVHTNSKKQRGELGDESMVSDVG